MAETTESGRREEALEVAFGLFLRFGYRKTSMDEIARAIGLSRQGLYLWFPNKKALFSEMVQHLITATAAAVEVALAGDGSAEERIVAAFEAHSGAFVATGASAVAIDELLEASIRIVGDQVAAAEQEFMARLAGAVAPFADEQLSAADLAQVLYSVSMGVKHHVKDRAEYRERMHKAVLLVCRTR
ncbi:MAG: TetR/AcrR family transcriptional regulator [Proteobacteria bacterium]|nr:TetR/AcrR family transcriptional regulator [Pseudomonadota bacterium]